MRSWWPLVAVCLGTFMFLLDTTVLSVALPAIGTGLSAPLSTLSWVADVYTLVLAVLMLTMGSLADRLGARRLYLAGLAVFGAASLACGLAWSPMVLVGARGVQGVGGAAMAVTAFALIGSVYRGPDLGRAMGVFGAVTGLSAAIGPMLGGVLTEYLSWRAIFFLNVPLAVATIALSSRVLEKGRRPAEARFDLTGVITFALGAGALTYGLTAGQQGRAAALVVAVLALAVFAYAELRSRTPLLDVRLFARASFSAVMACVLASTAAFAALVYTSVWLQSGLGLGPVRAGLALMPLALASFVTSLAGGRRLRGRSPRALLAWGLLLSGIGCALQAVPGANASAATLAVGLAVTGVGVGLGGPAMGAAVFAALPPERSGMAAGAMTTFRQLGQTLGVAVFGVLFQRHGAGTSGGLDRVMIAAAVIGVVGSVLARAFVPRPAVERAAAPPPRDLTGPGAQR
ncbi:MFS transporter [Actinoallomurus oryzae]|uniref:MFS transporter n=1 Tax=Actinoallomurus oryzae TaxID=502180 RepID=A0ABP8PYJ2_9ACTN